MLTFTRNRVYENIFTTTLFFPQIANNNFMILYKILHLYESELIHLVFIKNGHFNFFKSKILKQNF